MKTLPDIRPTPEQLPLISSNRLGVEVIRGAAGSGKTSTAILRLRSLAYMLEERNEREGIDAPVKILVLTFNRTLAGYVRELVEAQVNQIRNTEVTISTFGKWARDNLNELNVVSDRLRDNKIKALSKNIPLQSDYVVKEIDYLLGRFPPDGLEDYIDAERTGRGQRPRVEKATRRLILDQVVYPYLNWLVAREQIDWNGAAVEMSNIQYSLEYDVVIIDETQDFSVNQLKAVSCHLAARHAVTFVIDTIQRIYARGFTWPETGFNMQGARYHQLAKNHRNTKQVASFAAGLLEGMVAEADGTLPRLENASSDGSLPIIIKGKYGQQCEWAIRYIHDRVDLRTESVAFLKPQGLFAVLEGSLREAKIPFVNITRQPDWPEGKENVALSTFHSAKGLEFDHVIILGLNAHNTDHGDEDLDDQLTVLRRLLAVAVARARKTVVIGYKPGEQSDLVQFFKDGTFQELNL